MTMTQLAVLRLRRRRSSIYANPFAPPPGYRSPYHAWGIYRYPYDPECEGRRPGRRLPSLLWPHAVFAQVREALAELLLADLRRVMP